MYSMIKYCYALLGFSSSPTAIGLSCQVIQSLQPPAYNFTRVYPEPQYTTISSNEKVKPPKSSRSCSGDIQPPSSLRPSFQKKLNAPGLCSAPRYSGSISTSIFPPSSTNTFVWPSTKASPTSGWVKPNGTPTKGQVKQGSTRRVDGLECGRIWAYLQVVELLLAHNISKIRLPEKHGVRRRVTGK